jgi:dTDP-4-amino-4,6-dideoxygalactose transaminase
MSTQSFIPFHRPSIDGQEIDAVLEVLRSGWLTSGPRTAEFEKEFAAYVQADRALAANSGTAALHLALAALGVGQGDEVITTPLTFCATVNVILQVGAEPVLADIGPDLNIDPASVRDRLGGRTRVLLPVHYGGLPADMSALWEMAAQRGIAVVEDAAHAVGALYRGNKIGGANPGLGCASDGVAFSFYATKCLSTGEGGMLTSPREDVLNRARILCLHGISKDAWNRYAERGNWYYEVVESGFKYNLSDLQSALGLAQLRKQERLLQARATCAAFYNEQFRDLDTFELPPDREDCRHAWHLYPLRLNLSRLRISRAEFIEKLRARGVGSSVHFIPIPKHPFFARYARRKRNACPVAMETYERLISLPIYPDMTESQMDTVAAAVKAIAGESRVKAAPAGAAGN